MEPKIPKMMAKIMVFRPTLQQMEDFASYIAYMESQGAHKAGIAKIIPPDEWVPRKSGYDNIDGMTITAPITQIVQGVRGAYTIYNIQKKSMSLKAFKALALSPKYATPDFFDYDDLERKFWKNLTYISPIYGADVPGTLTDSDCKIFNINKLNTILDMINQTYNVEIKGVNTAYLYFGMWKASFAWHTEDMDLYSINYLHYGAPKSWYAIPSEYGLKFERVANDFFPEHYATCQAFLRHKMSLISPSVLKKLSIPFNKITQEKGEFMITFPYAYHAGYNHGYNIAESTNFALPRWVEFGKRAIMCFCHDDTVRIKMHVFVKKFQPDIYEKWLAGEDNGIDPKDPFGAACIAPKPTSEDEEELLKQTPKPFVISKCKPKRPRRQIIQPTEGVVTIDCSNDDCTKESFNVTLQVKHGGGDRLSKNKKTKTNSSFLPSNDVALHDSFGINDLTASGDKSSDLPVADTNGNLSSSNGTSIAASISFETFLLPDKSIQPIQNVNNSHSLRLTLVPPSLSQGDSNLNELSGRTLQYAISPTAYEDEVKFNLLSSISSPHCAVCSLMKPCSTSTSSNPEEKGLPPLRGAVMIPKAYFLSKVKQKPTVEQSWDESDLLCCSSCKICVHTVCYGIYESVVQRESWKCDRCLESDFEAACCLCPLRGGPLKRTTSYKWAHIVCSLVLPDVQFENYLTLKPIDVNEIEDCHVLCKLCHKNSNFSLLSSYIMGYCIQCDSCRDGYHVTCGHRCGVTFNVQTEDNSLKVLCKKCKSKSNRKEHRVLKDIEVNSSVVAKFHAHYAYAKLVSKKEDLFHRVQFVDNTLVSYIKSCDILNQDCEKEKPSVGDPVEVIWNKEQLHGKYAGSHVSMMYTVEFDNQVRVTLRREDLYCQDEALPKRVKLKLIDSVKDV